MRRIVYLLNFVIIMWHARKVQDYLWGSHSNGSRKAGLREWLPVLEKRFYKLYRLDHNNRHWKVEARKRLLQLAAVSAAMLEALDSGHIDNL